MGAYYIIKYPGGYGYTNIEELAKKATAMNLNTGVEGWDVNTGNDSYSKETLEEYKKRDGGCEEKDGGQWVTKNVDAAIAEYEKAHGVLDRAGIELD